MMQFIDLVKQQEQQLDNGILLKDLIKLNIDKVLDHGQYILGPEVSELEAKLSKYVGVRNCITVSSGTDALLISLMSLGLQPGDEVITTPFSFIASTEIIALIGAIPRFVDIDPKTYNLDPTKIEKLINNNTKAIIGVSLYGQPADFTLINEIAERYGIVVIEDGAQSFGSTHYGKKSCSLTTIGTTSFFPSKPFGCYGDGGAVFTDDDKLANTIRSISKHGQEKRYIHERLGVNGRLDTLQAAILLAKFKIFDKEIILRAEIGGRFTEKLNQNNIISTPQIEGFNTSTYAQYTIRVSDREKFRSIMKKKGIPTAVHYPRLLSHQNAISKYINFEDIDGSKLNIAKDSCDKVVSLPMHPYLNEKDQDFIVESVVSSIDLL